MMEMVLSGVTYRLDPAAVSALRYRAEYGESAVTHLLACRSAREEEARLLRICRMMIPRADRAPLRDFARTARRDRHFVEKARTAVDRLLAEDPRAPKGAEPGYEDFDEYDVLAVMAAARMDMTLIYELPILHLAGIAARCFQLQDPEHTERRPMTREERNMLYPRRKKG